MSVIALGAEAYESASSQERLERLGELEIIVDQGMDTFVEVGSALMEIRDSRLYRELHPTFEEYCVERWGFTASRARQMIAAVKTVTAVTTQGLPAPRTEGAARRLARELRAAAIAEDAEWRESLDAGGPESECTPTREFIEDVVPLGTAITEATDKALQAWRKSAQRHLDTTADFKGVLDAAGACDVLTPADRREIDSYAKVLTWSMQALTRMVHAEDGKVTELEVADR
jgi:hypothetical protein